MTRQKQSAQPIFKTGPLDPTVDRLICAPRPELDHAMRLIQAPTVERYLAIQGPRQTGKTTLLRQLRARLKPRGYGISFVNLAGAGEFTDAQFYPLVAGRILTDLRLAMTDSDPSKTNSVLPTHAAEFYRFLLQTAQRTDAPRLVILIDQLEIVPEKLAGIFWRTLCDVFSNRSKEEERALEKYIFILSSEKGFGGLSGNDLPEIAERIYLSDLDLAGVRILTLNFGRIGITAPEMTAQWIYDQTRGHPYLTQRLCSIIEQWHPATITPDDIRRASVQIIKRDDHLERLLQEIDADRRTRQWISQIIRGKSVPFNRAQRHHAMLEQVGAVRDDGQCAVRNPIYYAALHSHLQATQKQTPSSANVLRLFSAALMLLVFLINLPYQYNYASEILLAARSVDDRLSSSGLGSNVLIHYDRVLQPDREARSTISVDLEQLPPSGPLTVTFKPDMNDISLEGSRQRQINQPLQPEHLTFSLNVNAPGALFYNPFSSAVEHRQITLIFESAGRGVRLETYTADFLIDNFPAAAFSACVSLACLIGILGFTLFGHDRFRRVQRTLARDGTARGE